MRAFAAVLELVEQQPAGDKAIQHLRPLCLAFDAESRRAMEEHHAGRGLVDLLTTGPSGADEGFLEVLLLHTERLHALLEQQLLLRRDRHGADLSPSRGASLGPRRLHLTRLKAEDFV